MRPRRVIRGLVIATAALGFLGMLWLMARSGQFRSIEPHFSGHCTPVEGAVGVEDLVLVASGRAALLSSDDRRRRPGGDDSPGGIYMYRLDRLEAIEPPLLLSKNAPENFHPHGLDLVTTADGRGTLFVVNHPRAPGARPSDRPAERTIEVFDWRDGPTPRLTHRETIRDPLLVSPNDVVGVDHSRFYVTNDHGSASASARRLEDYGRRALASVVYFDGARARLAADGLRYANGVALRPDGRALYVSSSTDRALHVFDRDRETGALTRAATIELDTSADNISVEPSGTLWIAAHPKLLSFLLYSRALGRRSPSQVLRLRPSRRAGAPAEFELEEVYLDDGSELSGSSAAVRRGRRLLIGSGFDSSFLDCTMDPSPGAPILLESTLLAR